MHPLRNHPVAASTFDVPPNYLQLKPLAVLLTRMSPKRKSLVAQTALIPLNSNPNLSMNPQLPYPSTSIPLTPQPFTLRTSMMLFFISSFFFRQYTWIISLTSSSKNSYQRNSNRPMTRLHSESQSREARGPRANHPSREVGAHSTDSKDLPISC